MAWDLPVILSYARCRVNNLPAWEQLAAPLPEKKTHAKFPRALVLSNMANANANAMADGSLQNAEASS
jgi:hypothetical protein